MADEQPFALETCYLAADQFPGLSGTPLERRSLFTLLEQKYNMELAYADEELDATIADGRLQGLLRVPANMPLLRIRQVLYTAAGTPIVYSLALYRSDRYSLLTRRFR